MAVHLYLTDDDSDLSGYLRAKLGARSDTPSLVRSVTNTAAGPTSGVQVTRVAAGTALAWITDPLDGTDLTAAAWVFHVWAKESAAAANAALRFQVLPWTVAEQAAALDDNNGTELGTTIADYARTTGNASVTALADGDRLVIKLLIDDAGVMGASQTVTVAFNGQQPRAEGDSYVTCPDTLAVTAAMPAATRTTVRRAIQDVAATNPLLADAEVDQAFTSALRTYSTERPREVGDFASGDGSAFLFRLPRRWVWGFSQLGGIEYPYDAAEQVQRFLEREDWEIEQAALGLQPVRRLRFTALVPESGTDNILLRYTTRHEHTDELDTVPAEDLDAVCWLAGSNALLTLAAKMAGSSDSVIAADSVNYRASSDLYRSAAKALADRYAAHMRGGESQQASGTWVDWDRGLSTREDRLFHGRRQR